MRAVHLAILVAICSGLSHNVADAQEWTRFRGPNGSGVSPATSVPAVWTEKDYHWKVELPASGHSSPVLWADKIFLSGADDASADRYVFAVSAVDGKLLWSHKYPSLVHKRHKLNSFASPTAVCDADVVVYSWSSPDEYTLVAFDHAGKEKWKRNLGKYYSQHSAGVSPILYRDLVILVNGQDRDGDSSIIAVHRLTGENAWQLPRPSTTVPYSTPCIRKNAAGQDELIFNESNMGMHAVDPLTGKINWEIPSLIDKRSVSSPVLLSSGLITISCGSGGGGNFLLAVHPKDGTDKHAGQVAFKVDRTAPYVPTPVAVGDRLYMITDNGIAISVDAKTGETVWQKRVGGTFYGSMIAADNKLYCTSADGEVLVLAASDEYQLLARNPLGETSHSTPAIARGHLFLRTVNHLICVGGDKPKLAAR